MKEISLTRNQKTIVDDEDYQQLSSFKWQCSTKGYATRSELKSERKNVEKRGIIFMHDFIMKCPEGMVVDHKNGDKLDNRKENLRICTQPDNMKNIKKKQVNKTSSYKGVCWHKGLDMWCLQISKKFVAYFTNEVACANAYNYLANIIHEEFASPNEVDVMTEDEWKPFAYWGNGQSKYKGVFKTKNNWRSAVSFNGKKYGCGSFKTEDEAFEAYKLKYVELYGESHLSWLLY